MPYNSQVTDTTEPAITRRAPGVFELQVPGETTVITGDSDTQVRQRWHEYRATLIQARDRDAGNEPHETTKPEAAGNAIRRPQDK
jgi:hypothetical protein